jgi:hypothetical protein
MNTIEITMPIYLAILILCLSVGDPAYKMGLFILFCTSFIVVPGVETLTSRKKTKIEHIRKKRQDILDRVEKSM